MEKYSNQTNGGKSNNLKNEHSSMNWGSNNKDQEFKNTDGTTTDPELGDTQTENEQQHSKGEFAYISPQSQEFGKRSGNSYPWKIDCGSWCKKYFRDEHSSNEAESIEPETELPSFSDDQMTALSRKYRTGVGLMAPALVVHFFWWAFIIKHDLWYLFPERYVLVIAMVFASTLAGLTSIGGATVSFPVLTLILHVSPEVARDFGLLIRSFGMTAATFTIIYTGVQIEWNVIIWGTLGGTIGLIGGLELIEKHMSPSLKKMIFASFWFSFAFALFLLNRNRNRKTFPRIMMFKWWKALILVVTGIVGGIFSSFVGSGLDICSLSVLTLFFRISEKQATPTGVVLITINSILGSFWRQAIQNTISLDTWYYVIVSVGVCVVGSPLGSFIGIYFHRLVLAGLIYVILIVTLVSSYVLVPQTTILIVVSVSVIIAGGIVFLALTLLGQRLLNWETKSKEEPASTELAIGNGKSIEINQGKVNGGYVHDKKLEEGMVTISKL